MFLWILLCVPHDILSYHHCTYRSLHFLCNGASVFGGNQEILMVLLPLKCTCIPCLLQISLKLSSNPLVCGTTMWMFFVVVCYLVVVGVMHVIIFYFDPVGDLTEIVVFLMGLFNMLFPLL